MNTFSRLILLLLLCLTMGCKSIARDVFNNKEIQRVEIATVGIGETSLFKNKFNSVGFITLHSPIKLEVIPVPMTNGSYKEFLVAKASQFSDLDIIYVDSLKQKPKYLTVKIADVLNLMNQLHESSNENVKKYLETNQRAGIVTSISIAYPKTLMNEMLEAESVFLVQSRDATYQLQLILKSGEIKQTSLKDGVTINHEVSKACWETARQNYFRIVELIESRDKCSSGTYRSPRFIRTEDDYFKF